MSNFIPRKLLLPLGVVLITAAHFRWGLGAVAWVIPVPFLIYLNGIRLKRELLYLAIAFTVGFSLATLKIITWPIAWPMAFFFGIPIGLFHGAPYLLLYLLRRWLPRRGTIHLEIFLFAACSTLFEFFQYTFTPLGTWGAQADTQLGNLPLLQLAAFTGISGIALLVHWSGALLARWVMGQGKKVARHTAIFLIILSGILIAGQLRMEMGSLRGSREVTVATIATDSTVGTQKNLPTKQKREETLNRLLEHTRRAGSMGAQVAVWPEAAILIFPAEETAFLEKVRHTAKKAHLHLIAAYVMLLSKTPLKYRNAFVWVRPDGTIDHTYLKHRPVPGEPAVRGTKPHKFVRTTLGTMSGAICYDFDFPDLGRKKAGADLVLLPSSDWRGIDPIHTQMASLRAIENGYSLVRATRFGTSAAYDPYGRSLGRRSSWESADKILLVRIPAAQVPTLYAALGPWLIYLLFGLLCLLFIPYRRMTRTSRHPSR